MGRGRRLPRKRALSILNDMATGVDPNAEKRRVAQESVTVGQAFDRFFATRTSIVDRTRDRYQRTVDLYLKDWRRTSVTCITRQMILTRHQHIGKVNGEATANNVMRHFRSVYNVAAAAHDEFPPNP
jgi:hypothetical protein